jgi:plasmid stabilization system protein ParE
VNLRISSNVQKEIREAVEYYEAEQPGLGDRFWKEVDAHVHWILANPTIPRLRVGDYRRVNLHVFPYYIAYAIRQDDIILLAVAHAYRRPQYWMNPSGGESD